MAYNLHDIERGTKQVLNTIESTLDRRAHAQAEAFSERVSRTRGLWVFPHIGAFAALFVTVGTFVGVAFKATGWMPYAIAAAVAAVWWSATFTKKHPFLSFVLGGFLAPVALLSFARN